jgi:hypothetical protein
VGARGIAALERSIGDLNLHNHSLGEQVAERDRAIGSMLASTSWRVTAPLRALKRLTVAGRTNSKTK